MAQTVAKLGAVLLLTVGGYVAVPWHQVEEFLAPTRLAMMLNEAGPLAPLLLVFGMATAVVVAPIPSLPLDLAAGAAYGPLWGTIYVVIGAEIGAILSFLIARWLGREVITGLLKSDLTFCQACNDHQLLGLMFFARLIPVFSFDVISYGAGLTKVSLKGFALVTLFRMIPPTFAFTYFGSSVVSAQWALIAASVAMVGLFFVVPKILLRYRSSTVSCLILGPASPRPADVHRAGLRPAIACAGCNAALI
jgi:uncharacterized membrane protein YdjX (TVP38/TMEM64 family)